MTDLKSALEASAALQRLLEIMYRLRDPVGGCPWDRQQTFASIAPYTIEEAYEVADAIARDDLVHLKDELGDLLFQVVFHAQMAEESGAFDFADVAKAICDKMLRRHPHIFAAPEERPTIISAVEQTEAWERHKAAERSAAHKGVLDGVPVALPALTRALKLQSRAARVGFDWAETAPVLEKITEELDELRQELSQRAEQERLAEELGDLLFACVNIARHMGVDPEAALRGASRKFERRFRWIEERLSSEGRNPEQADLEELDRLWQTAKVEERRKT